MKADRNSEVRIVKFKWFIEEIWRYMPEEKHMEYDDRIKNFGWIGLALIYDYRRLNDYGKIIMDFPKGISPLPHAEQEIIQRYDDIGFRIEATQKFEEEFGYSITGREKIYKFIFWALMILTVDDADKEEHLSFICDFARRWEISDEEMMSISKIVRLVYRMENISEIKLQIMNGFYADLKKSSDEMGIDFDNAYEFSGINFDIDNIFDSSVAECFMKILKQYGDIDMEVLSKDFSNCIKFC